MPSQEELKNRQRKVYQRIIDDYQRKVLAFERKFDNLVKNNPDILNQLPTEEEKEYIGNLYWINEFKKELEK